MTYKWHTNAIHIIYKWLTHDTKILCTWTTNDVHVNYTWFAHDVQVMYKSYTHAIRMIYKWRTNEIHMPYMIYKWRTHDIDMLYTWNTNYAHMIYKCYTNDIQMTYEWYTHVVHIDKCYTPCYSNDMRIKYKWYNMSIEHWLLFFIVKVSEWFCLRLDLYCCCNSFIAESLGDMDVPWGLGGMEKATCFATAVTLFTSFCANWHLQFCLHGTDSWNFSFAMERVGPKETKPLLVVSKAVRERKKHNMIEGS